jgi:hypothetical protein
MILISSRAVFSGYSLLAFWKYLGKLSQAICHFYFCFLEFSKLLYIWSSPS